MMPAAVANEMMCMQVSLCDVDRLRWHRRIAYHHPALSTIQYPFDEVARLAWEFLSRRLEQPDTPLQGATLTAQLVLRE